MAFVLPTDRLEHQKVLVELARGKVVTFVVDGKSYTITPRQRRAEKRI